MGTTEWRAEGREEDINQPKKGRKTTLCRGNSMATSPMVGDAELVPGTGGRLGWSEFKIKGTQVMGMTAGVRPCRICEPQSTQLFYCKSKEKPLKT